MKNYKVLLGVTGSIAAYKSCDVVRRLRDQQCEVTVIMTDGAEKFITSLTLEALTGRPVYRDMFSRDVEWDMAHISLAKWADIFLIAPATANIIAKMACGIADDLITTTAISTKVPMLVAPAMNKEMYLNQMVQDNITKLKERGVVFIGPKEGKLACGDVGMGNLADVDVIVSQVLSHKK